MKALLIQPPLEDFYLSPARAAALGLEAMKPVLEAAGWTWTLKNYPLEQPRGRVKPLPRELSHLKDHLIQGEGGPVSFFKSWHRFGPEAETLAAEAAAENPDMILISCFAWAYAGETLELLPHLRAACPDAFILVGGAGATVMPLPFLSAGAHGVLRGEAEAGFPALLRALAGGRPLNKVPNLVLPGGTIPEEPPLVPEGPVAPVIGRVGGGPVPRYSASITRGCPRGCLFCSNRLCHGTTFRRAALEDVKAMLKHRRIPTPGAGWHVNFEDDNLLMDQAFFLQILDIFHDEFPGRRFTFSAENGLDYTLLKRDLLRDLKEIGLTQLNLSLGAFHPDRAAEQNRFLRPDLYEAAAGAAAALDLPVITYFIAGLPGDTAESCVDALVYLAGQPTRAGISLFYPVPGLEGLPSPEVFRQTPPRLCAGSAAWPWAGSLSTEEMITAFRLSRLVNLLKEPGDYHELIETIRVTRRLHTLVKKDRRWVITPVPRQDEAMVERFFRGIRDSAVPPRGRD